MKRATCLLLCLSLPAVLSTAAAASPQNAPPAPDVKKGGELYTKYGCWECHGYTGSTGNGAPLAITSLNATGFTNYIRNPRTTGMPLYSAKVVSDAEAADL